MHNPFRVCRGRIALSRHDNAPDAFEAARLRVLFHGGIWVVRKESVALGAVGMGNHAFETLIGAVRAA